MGLFSKKPITLKDLKMNSKNISCEGCRNKITKMLKHTKGVDDINVDLKTKDVDLKYNPDKITPDKILSKMSDINYPATIVRG